MMKGVLALSALSVSACAHAPTPVVVVPGLAVKFETSAPADTVVYRRSILTGTQDSSAGSRTVVLRIDRSTPGIRHLEVEQRFPAGGGIIVDTAVAELPGLRAVAHRSHQPTRTMRFEFGDAQASGVVTPRDSAGQTVQQDVGGLIFDSNILDLVVASLPLRAGLTTELPFSRN